MALEAGRSVTGERFGHPKGLWVLAGTELWDRISFHGMQAILTLYLVSELLLRGTAPITSSQWECSGAAWRPSPGH